MKNTDLLKIINKILAAADNQSSPIEELYFLKLEAIWILISISLGSKEVCEHLI